jgi:hypothetical protein
VDQSTNGSVFVQATGGKQPTINASDATLNNRSTVSGDGISKEMFSVGVTIAASFSLYAVIKYSAFAVNDRMVDNGGRCTLLGQGAPSVVLFENGLNTPINNGFGGAGAWKRVIMQEQNTAADRLVIGSATATGVALGRTASTGGLALFGSGGGFFANASLAELILTDGPMSAGEYANMDIYASSRYLASILT